MTETASQSTRQTLRDLVLLTVLIGALFGVMLGNRPLSVPDEGRYVEIAREMASTGDYVTPRLNGVKYFEKPVLFYWLENFSIKLFGLGEYGLRLWPALFALFGCLAVYVTGKRLYGRKAGLIAAVVLATSLLYYALSRLIVLDMAVSVLISASLLSFLVAMHEPTGLKRRLLLWGFYGFAALAVLTKGLIGIVLPGLVIVAWVAVLGEWRLLKTFCLPSGLLLFLLIAAPWHLLVGRANPEFFKFYFIHEHFERYLTKIHDRYKPAWFFVPVLLFGFFPWTAFLVQSVKFSAPLTWRERHEHRDAIFLLLWAGLIFLFFSASDSKLIPYILPVFPPLAILIGRYLAQAWKDSQKPPLVSGYVLLSLFSVLLMIALAAAPHYRPEIDARGLHQFFDASALVLGIGVLAAWALAKWKNLTWSVYSVAAYMAVFLILLNSLGPHLDTRSVKGLALELKPRLTAADEVANFRTYYQDLPVYLQRRITVVDWQGELKFGMTVDDTRAWMMDSASFWKRWKGPETIYLFTKRNDYDELIRQRIPDLHYLAGSKNTVLLVNKEKQS